MTRHRVAVLFFGMSRRAAATAESIQAQVLGHALNRDIDFFVASSLNYADVIRNPRSGEHGVSLDKYDIDHLPCDLNIFIRQNDATIDDIFQVVRQTTDYYRNNHLSNKVLLHQLHSLKMGFAALEAIGLERFSAVVFLRPDLFYEDPLDIAGFVERHAQGHVVSLPAWHAWGGYNDRLAIASISAARHYARRLDLVAAYCRSETMHAERLLAHALRQGGVTVELLSTRAHRVRWTGGRVQEDFTKGGRPGGRT